MLHPPSGPSEEPAAGEAGAAAHWSADAELMHALTENLPLGLFVFDAKSHRLVALNAHAEHDFGLRRDAVVGQLAPQALGPALCALVEPGLHQAARGHSAAEHDFEWRAGVTPRHFSARHVAVRHADGSARLVLVMLRDTTAQRGWQESLALNHEFAEAIDDSLFVSNPQRSQFDFIAGSAFETWGMTRDQFAARPNVFLDHVVEEDRGLLVERQRREQACEPADITFRIQHPTKGLRWLRSRTRTRAVSGAAPRVYGLVCDVTVERQRESELERARDAAEAASRTKSQFMANMSHEIRTPMNGILGMTELLLGTALTDQQRRFAQAVYGSGESLLEIINDILDFSKIEAGKLELASADFVLRTVAEDTLELLKPRAHAKGLELSLREEPGLPTVVCGDALRLRQVLTNLVANAIKFTEHGEVVVDLRRGPTLDVSGALHVEIRVSDSGIGIDRDALVSLFSPFTQGHAGMSKRYGGTGLGLAISRQLAERMGGSIEAKSTPGVGSDFLIKLPFEPASGHSGTAEPGESSIGLNRDVLVVEDNLVNQQVIGQMLQNLGCRAQLAAGAMEGLRALCEKRFDLVLMDIQMPGMDGTDALRWFRRGGGGRFDFVTPIDTPVVAVTANALAGDEVRLRGLGFDDYLSKPFRRTELLAMLTRHLIPGAPVSSADTSPAGASAAAKPALQPTATRVGDVLDAAALARLRELDPKGDNKLLQRVLTAFQTSIGRLVPQVQEAARTQDLAGVRHVAHTLKSSSASIGAVRLAQMCAELEAMIRLDKVEALDSRVKAMCDEVEIVLKALKNLLDDKA